MAKDRAAVSDTSRSATRPAGKAGAAKPRPGSKSRSGFSKALPWIVGGVIALAIIVGLVLLVQSNTGLASAPGERIAIQGNNHIEVGAAHAPYNSDPPTSGPHYAEPASAGFYDTPRPDEELIHNLEHGHVWIAYDCSKLTNCDQVKQQLSALVQNYNQWKIVVTPRQNKDAAIALVAWGWLQKLNGYDETAIKRFVDAWRNKGPEATAE